MSQGILKLSFLGWPTNYSEYLVTLINLSNCAKLCLVPRQLFKRFIVV